MRRFLVPAPRSAIEPGAPPTFSVLIPAYQAADTIAEAVESALSQTVPPHEVLVCDDGSTDNLAGALRPYRGQVRLVHQENRGHGVAMDTATRAATAEFVAILDADDIFLAERLEALTELALARPDLDILTTDEYFEVGGKTVGRFYEHNPFPLEDQASGILETCFPGGHPAVRRDRLLAAGGFARDLRIGADWECWLRLILGGSRAGLVDEPLLCYRLHDRALTSSRVDTLAARVRILEKRERNPNIAPQQQRVLAASLARKRHRVTLAEIEAAASGNLSNPRRRLLSLLTRRGIPWRGRLLAAGSLAAPGLAQGYLSKRRGSEHSVLVPPMARWK